VHTRVRGEKRAARCHPRAHAAQPSPQAEARQLRRAAACVCVQDAIVYGEVTTSKRTTDDGQEYYDYVIESGSNNYLVSITTRQGRLFAVFVNTPNARVRRQSGRGKAIRGSCGSLRPGAYGGMNEIRADTRRGGDGCVLQRFKEDRALLEKIRNSFVTYEVDIL
jgi:hypothetical protein